MEPMAEDSLLASSPQMAPSYSSSVAPARSLVHLRARNFEANNKSAVCNRPARCAQDFCELPESSLLTRVFLHPDFVASGAQAHSLSGRVVEADVKLQMALVALDLHTTDVIKRDEAFGLDSHETILAGFVSEVY
jgi:hypothetical protein